MVLARSQLNRFFITMIPFSLKQIFLNPEDERLNLWDSFSSQELLHSR